MKITIETNVAAPIAEIWFAFNDPDDIMQWDASDEWHTTQVSNDLRIGGKLILRIERNDGKMGADFTGIYTKLESNRLIEFVADDGCTVNLAFIETDNGVVIRQTFDAYANCPEEQQRSEWQTVLESFARYVEQQKRHNRNPR